MKVSPQPEPAAGLQPGLGEWAPGQATAPLLWQDYQKYLPRFTGKEGPTVPANRHSLKFSMGRDRVSGPERVYVRRARGARSSIDPSHLLLKTPSIPSTMVRAAIICLYHHLEPHDCRPSNRWALGCFARHHLKKLTQGYFLGRSEPPSCLLACDAAGRAAPWVLCQQRPCMPQVCISVY